MKNYIKKIALSIVLIIPTLIVLYFGTYFLQNILLRHSFESEYIPSNSSYIVHTKLHRCGFSILKPELTRITEFEDREEKRMSFYKPEHLFSQTKEEWKESRTGGTTITNTTFPELVAMVKEDCSQLQEDYDNPKVDEGGIDWGYREAEPPKTQEEIEEERRERANDVREYLLEDYNEEQRERIKEVYGISIESADNDLIEWDNEIIPEDDERLSDVFPEEKGPNRPFDPYLFDDVQVPQQK